MTERSAKLAWHLEGKSEISMSGGLRNEGTGRVDARTNDDPFVDGALEAKHWAAEVPHRCKTPHQRRLSLSCRQQLQIVRIRGHQGHLRRSRHEGVPMRVDETRHKHTPIPRDNAHLSARINCNRSRRYALDGLTCHEDIDRLRESRSFPIENAHVLKKCCGPSARRRPRFQARTFQIQVALRETLLAKSDYKSSHKHERHARRAFQFSSQHRSNSMLGSYLGHRREAAKTDHCGLLCARFSVCARFSEILGCWRERRLTPPCSRSAWRTSTGATDPFLTG